MQVKAAVLISPIDLHDLTRGLIIFSAMSLLITPIAGWRIYLTEFAFPGSGGSRLAAVIRLWLGGSLMSGAVFNLLFAIFRYSPTRPGPSPRIGFLIAEFTICILVATGVFGGFAAIFPREILIRCAVVSGLVLFLGVATLGFMVFG